MSSSAPHLQCPVNATHGFPFSSTRGTPSTIPVDMVLCPKYVCTVSTMVPPPRYAPFCGSMLPPAKCPIPIQSQPDCARLRRLPACCPLPAASENQAADATPQSPRAGAAPLLDCAKTATVLQQLLLLLDVLRAWLRDRGCCCCCSCRCWTIYGKGDAAAALEIQKVALAYVSQQVLMHRHGVVLGHDGISFQEPFPL